jgi:hypothetical protein
MDATRRRAQVAGARDPGASEAAAGLIAHARRLIQARYRPEILGTLWRRDFWCHAAMKNMFALSVLMSMVLASCGGGGDDTMASNSPAPAPAPSGQAPAPAPGTGTGTGVGSSSAPAPAPVIYALQPASRVNETSGQFPNLYKIALLAGGGYAIVWNIPVGQPGNVTFSYFQQRYDAAGAKVGANEPWTGDTGTPQLVSRVDLPNGGFLQFQVSATFPSALTVQQFDAQGAALAPAMEPLAGARAPGWVRSGVLLPNGDVVIAMQPVNQTGPGEISTSLLVPAGS